MTTKARRAGVAIAFLALLGGCDRQPPVGVPSAATLEAKPWALPAADGAAQPDLSVTPQGALLLSWVARSGDTQRLVAAQFRDGKWDASRTITSGRFVGSGVDTPHVRMSSDGAMWAQWLRKSTSAGHARDVVLARSDDGGANWAEPVTVNLDATATEHGFVSMWPTGSDRVGIAWLDGRARAAPMAMSSTPAEAHPHSMHASPTQAGATMLRAAFFDHSLVRHDEVAVDARTCDCCQTDMAVTPKGPLLVYRDRGPGEVRDIAAVRLADARWSAPRIVHADGWVMPGCPINGPGIASDGDRVAVAWYTGAGTAPSIRLALSRDAGDSFDQPILLESGAKVRGEVDVRIDNRYVWISWLSESKQGAVVRVARVELANRKVERIDVARLAARGRTGAPRLGLIAGTAYLVWTDARSADETLLLAATVTSGRRTD